MAFPVSILPVKGELYVNGSWVDVSSYVRGEGANAFIINRGYASEQKSLQTSSCSFTLDNTDGRFNNRNPLSPYYGILPKNIPFRVRIDGYGSYLALNTFVVASVARTADKAALDIVGDIDIAIDIEPNSWTPEADTALAAKYIITSNDRSWFFSMTSEGKLRLYWSPDGTFASRVSRTSTTALPTSSPRLSVRAFLDVNNGASGHTVTFYYSTTGITGPWTQLGTPVVTAGVTSIHSGIADLDVGNNTTLTGFLAPARVYKFLLKNSAGTTVASPDFTAADASADSFTDAQGNIFNLLGSKFSNDGVRFTGEVARFPYQADKTNKDLYSNIESAGVVRRLTQGDKPLRSPLFRMLNQYPAITGYFPLEDGSDAKAAANEAFNGQPASILGISFNSDETLPGTAGVATIDDPPSYIKGTLNPIANTGEASVCFFFKMPAPPVIETLLARFFTLGSGIRKWEIYVNATGYAVRGFNDVGDILTSSSSTFGPVLPTSWVGMNLDIRANGTDLDWALDFTQVGSGQFFSIFQTAVPRSVGRFSGFEILGSTYLTGTEFAHILFTQGDLPFVDGNFANAAFGYINETAGDRLVRLSKEEGQRFFISGQLSETQPMGAQKTDSYLNLMDECAAVDDGLLIESKDFLGLEYITRASLTNITPTTELNFSAGDLSGEFLPIDDDQRTVNDMTVSRPEGSSGRVIQTFGPNTPEIIGSYQSSISLNAANDPQLTYLAGWKVFLGTWDEPRYERVEVSLSRSNFTSNPALMESIVRANIGKSGRIVGIPTIQTADFVEYLIIGYQEKLGQFQWDISWNAQPYGPFEADKLSDSAANYNDKADAASGTLNAGINTTATSLSVAAGTDPIWITTATHPTLFPFDVTIGGERMRVTAISGTSSPQTFTVTRSINSIVKSHSAGSKLKHFDGFSATL